MTLVLYTPLSQAKINSEEDAEAALKLSSALTQALLAYRIKSVSTVRLLPASTK